VSTLAKILIVLVAVLHVLFLVLEMFFWTSPYGMKTFGTTPETAASSAKLAANQGLYNGFLAAGLLWSLWQEVVVGRPTALFFLGCVIVAAIFGAATANRRILVVQGLPAALAVAAVLFA
jgi:putative membrane protein